MSAKIKYERRRQAALSLMRHYLRWSFNGTYGSDQDAEMALLVDALIDAAVAKVAMQEAE